MKVTTTITIDNENGLSQSTRLEEQFGNDTILAVSYMTNLALLAKTLKNSVVTDAADAAPDEPFERKTRPSAN